jgi:cytochrome c peroxidase
MTTRSHWQHVTVCALSLLLASATAQAELTPKELLGKALFFDTTLSTPSGQSCAVCHTPEVGWTGPDSAINAHGAVYEGAVIGRFGNRKPPSSAYATPSPILHFSRRGGGLFIGGNFWDGRATGEKLGNPAADQAQGPFLNPLEQNNDSPQVVCDKVSISNFALELTGYSYGSLFDLAFGAGSLDCLSDTYGTYDRIALAIAAYEDSTEVNRFTSKYDRYLAGTEQLTSQEQHGLRLFNGKAKCARCHTSRPGSKGEPPLFTDFTYDNLGVPRNPENPFYTQTAFNPLGIHWIDLGLGDFLASRIDYERHAPANYGKQKVPTLRNVDKRPYPGFVKAFAHNGYFKSLKGIVHFYNTRDVKPRCPDAFTTEAMALAQGCWPEPEVAANVNTTELGNLRLTDAEEDALVAFMRALSD